MNILKKHKWQIIICLFIGFAIGICTPILIYCFTSTSIANEIGFKINPLEILSLVTNVFLAIYITSYLGTKIDTEKTEKNLIVEHYNRYQSKLIVDVSNLIDGNEFDTIKSKSTLKILRKKLTAITELAEESGFLDRNCQDSINIKEKLTDIWEDFTETVDLEGKEELLTQRKIKIEESIITIEKSIYNIVKYINLE